MPLLNIFGDLERFTTENLYPYRYVITPFLIAGALAALYVAYRLGAHLWVRRNPMISTAVGLPLLVISLVAGNYFLSPLWERSFLDEASPLAADVSQPGSDTQAGSSTGVGGANATSTAGPAATGGGDSSTATGGQQTSGFQATTFATGTVVGSDDFHFGRGDALIIEAEPGKFILRFENFSVRNGPDLFVYLSEDPSGESVDEALNLGELKATDGAFNYEIPPEIDVSRIRSAVVWCRQFSVLFAHAEFM